MQLSHSNNTFQRKSHSIILICDQVSSPANIGSLFRLADAFGIEKIVFGGVVVDMNSARLKRTSRSTHKWTRVENAVDLNTYLPKLVKENYYILALEITEKSKALQHWNLPQHSKLALVIGDENAGISSGVLNQCSEQVHINMFGVNSSMNVAQAAAIALYEITKHIN